MPKINNDAINQTTNDMVDHLSAPQVIHVTSPVFTCGVQRKLNTGNFENLDIYAGLSIPLPGGSLQDKEMLKHLVEIAAELGFSITSQETGQRYNALKELQKNGRK